METKLIEDFTDPGFRESFKLYFRELGFIREFSPEYRRQGHGSQLLGLAEEYFAERGVTTAALTTDTAPGFYAKHGYRHDPGSKAKNGDPVYIKHLY